MNFFSNEPVLLLKQGQKFRKFPLVKVKTLRK